MLLIKNLWSESLNRTYLYEISKEFGIPKKFVNLIKMMQDTNRKVKIQGQLMEAFGIERGLRQGDALSKTLLNIVLEEVIRNTEANPHGTIVNTTRNYIAKADEVLILG